MKCFLPSEQWCLGQMPATLSPDFPSPSSFLLKLRLRLVERHGSLGAMEQRHNLQREEAQPELWRHCNDANNRSRVTIFKDIHLLRKSEICQSLFRFKSVWTLLEIFRLAFQDFFSPLAGLKNRIKTGIGILQESARTCFDVFSCAWLKSRFGWIVNRYVYLI